MNPSDSSIVVLQREMAGYLKTTCKVQQMVTNGNEGYRVLGRYDQYAPVTYPFRNWCATLQLVKTFYCADRWMPMSSMATVCIMADHR